MPFKVYLVDDDRSICEAIQWLLKSVGLEARIFYDAMQFINFYSPKLKGCLVIDVRLPKMSGMTLLQQLIEAKCQLPVVMLTGHGDIAMAVRAIKMGAMDFITKPFDQQYLIDVIQQAIAVNSRQVASGPQEEYRIGYDSLTERERTILTHLIEGKLNKQIAAEMNLSLSTIESSRTKIMCKMNARTLADLIKKTLLICPSLNNFDCKPGMLSDTHCSNHFADVLSQKKT